MIKKDQIFQAKQIRRWTRTLKRFRTARLCRILKEKGGQGITAVRRK